MNININRDKLILPEDIKRRGLAISDVTDFNKGNENLDLMVKAHQNKKLLDALSNKDGSQTKAAKLRKTLMDTTKGVNTSGTMQWVGRIPLVVWEFAVRTYGEKALEEDKLFNEVFEPWIIVDKSRLRK